MYFKEEVALQNLKVFECNLLHPLHEASVSASAIQCAERHLPSHIKGMLFVGGVSYSLKFALSLVHSQTVW